MAAPFRIKNNSPIPLPSIRIYEGGQYINSKSIVGLRPILPKTNHQVQPPLKNVENFRSEQRFPPNNNLLQSKEKRFQIQSSPKVVSNKIKAKINSNLDSCNNNNIVDCKDQMKIGKERAKRKFDCLRNEEKEEIATLNAKKSNNNHPSSNNNNNNNNKNRQNIEILREAKEYLVQENLVLMKKMMIVKEVLFNHCELSKFLKILKKANEIHDEGEKKIKFSLSIPTYQAILTLSSSSCHQERTTLIIEPTDKFEEINGALLLKFEKDFSKQSEDFLRRANKCLQQHQCDFYLDYFLNETKVKYILDNFVKEVCRLGQKKKNNNCDCFK